MILPLDGVQVANLVDPGVYNEYFAEAENASPEPGEDRIESAGEDSF
jgi:hypothetical protein